MTALDITAWADDDEGALHELARIGRDLGTPGGEEDLLARLKRLTAEQRAEAEAMERAATR